MTALDTSTEHATLVDDVMVTRPKTLPAASCTVAEAQAAFTDHVHMLLLVDAEGRLEGTLCRDDLTAAGSQATAGTAGTAPDDVAVGLARLEGRCVRLGTTLEVARAQLEALGVRRVAVVDERRRLCGLLCLKRHRHGFCSDEGIAARAAD